MRRWTKSQYSHAELILNDKTTWIGISPFIKSQVTDRKNVEYNPENWDFYKIPITDEQYTAILDFYDITKGATYDWIGMLLSQFLSFNIKQKYKWYCSEWITNALVLCGVINWSSVHIYDKINMRPSDLYEIVSEHITDEIQS